MSPRAYYPLLDVRIYISRFWMEDCFARWDALYRFCIHV